VAHRVCKVRQRLVLREPFVRLHQRTQTQRIVVATDNRATCLFDTLDGRARCARDNHINRCAQVLAAVAQQLDAVAQAVDAAAFVEFPRRDRLARVQAPLINPVLQAIEVERHKMLLVGVCKATLGDEPGQRRLSALESKSRLPVTGASLLTFVASRGRTTAVRATTATESLVLRSARPAHTCFFGCAGVRLPMRIGEVA